MKIPGLPIRIGLPLYVSFPLMLLFGLGYGAFWVVKRLIKLAKQRRALGTVTE